MEETAPTDMDGMPLPDASLPIKGQMEMADGQSVVQEQLANTEVLITTLLTDRLPFNSQGLE